MGGAAPLAMGNACMCDHPDRDGADEKPAQYRPIDRDAPRRVAAATIQAAVRGFLARSSPAMKRRRMIAKLAEAAAAAAAETPPRAHRQLFVPIDGEGAISVPAPVPSAVRKSRHQLALELSAQAQAARRHADRSFNHRNPGHDADRCRPPPTFVSSPQPSASVHTDSLF